ASSMLAGCYERTICGPALAVDREVEGSFVHVESESSARANRRWAPGSATPELVEVKPGVWETQGKREVVREEMILEGGTVRWGQCPRRAEETCVIVSFATHVDLAFRVPQLGAQPLEELDAEVCDWGHGKTDT